MASRDVIPEASQYGLLIPKTRVSTLTVPDAANAGELSVERGLLLYTSDASTPQTGKSKRLYPGNRISLCSNRHMKHLRLLGVSDVCLVSVEYYTE